MKAFVEIGQNTGRSLRPIFLILVVQTGKQSLNDITTYIEMLFLRQIASITPK